MRGGTGQPRESLDRESWEQHPGQGQAQVVGAKARRESTCMEIGGYSGSSYGGQFVRGVAGRCKVQLDSSPGGGHPSSEHHPHRRKG